MLPPVLEMPADLVQTTVAAAVEDIAASTLILVRWMSMTVVDSFFSARLGVLSSDAIRF